MAIPAAMAIVAAMTSTAIISAVTAMTIAAAITMVIMTGAIAKGKHQVDAAPVWLISITPIAIGSGSRCIIDNRRRRRGIIRHRRRSIIHGLRR
jgi:hypothetical protein